MKINYLSKETNIKIKLALIMLALSVVYVCLFSYTTSVLYPNYFGFDQAEFMTIGKMWSLGRLPYVTIFDHKGPIIFFVNMIGLVIGAGNKVGISIIQIIFMYFTIYGIYKISQLYKTSLSYGIICILLTLILMKPNYYEGDTVEEYCVPFLCWSAYYLLSWYKDRNTKGILEHNPKYGLLYGITFGVCLFTRVTNIAPITGLIFVVIVVLIVNRAWKNLFQNAIYFLAGVALIVLPFSIYFAANGALYDLWYGTLIHNVKYFNGAEPWLITYGAEGIKSFLEKYFLFYSIFFVIPITLWKKEYVLSIALSITALVEIYVFFGGFIAVQYPFVCVYQFVVLLNVLSQLLDEEDTAKRLVYGILISIVGYQAFKVCIYDNATKIVDYKLAHNKVRTREYQALVEEIPDEDMDSFVSYGRAELAEVYLVTNTVPCYKYAFIQDWYASFSDKVREEVRALYASGEAKWILSDQGTNVIDDILQEKYEVYDTREEYVLWKLKE